MRRSVSGGPAGAPRSQPRCRSPKRVAAAVHRRLRFRQPYDWDSLIGFLTPRSTPGVELVTPSSYRRTISVGNRHGTLEVRPVPETFGLELRLRLPRPASELPAIVERVRRQFDLDADPETIGAHLRRDPELAELVRARPGLRIPGAWDGFEVAVRAILGQQVSVAGATTLAGRLAAVWGEPFAASREPGLELLFPPPERLAAADLAPLGMPRVRAEAIRRLAEEVLEGRVAFDGELEAETLMARMIEIPGIGDWTAHYVAMRALGAADAFPAGDLVLRRAFDGGTITAARLRRRAEPWRPWRAYAAVHLWSDAATATASSTASADRRRSGR